MHKTLTQKIEEIKRKTIQLSEVHKKLISKNIESEKQHSQLKEQLERERLKTEELVNKIKIIKLAQNIGSEDSERTDVSELKRKINEYIKEIDHCITMLNN